MYASANTEEYAERGYYDHGQYPFIMDTTFPVEGSPAGFGYIDVCKNPQAFVDAMDQAILETAQWNSKKRYFETEGSGINVEDYLDTSKQVVKVKGSRPPSEMLMEIGSAQLPAESLAVRNMKVEELKETSGNRDFSQGSTASGVTAASAIAALQEAGSKTSRDMIGRGYQAFQEVGYLCIELMRQFYNEPRIFRVIGKNGEMKFREFQGNRMAEQATQDGFIQESYRVPVFDIKVVAQRKSPFSTVVQNETAKELYSAGFFRPDLADQSYAALSMMQFEGIDDVRERIGRNGLLFQKMQQITPLVIQLAQELDMYKGTNYTPQIAQILGMEVQNTPEAGEGGTGGMRANALGDAFQTARGAQAGEARKNASANSMPNGHTRRSG
ncbi:MAG: hypothetical protein JW811_00730 [Clostridiales bacterium]|nr:hypothetical protein [Clostridiales bacterium]